MRSSANAVRDLHDGALLPRPAVTATLEDMIRHYQLEFEGFRRVIPDFLPWPLRPDPITDDQFAPLIAYLKKI